MDAQFQSLIDAFSPPIAQRARLVLARLEARLPGVWRLVYDNHNACAIGFATEDKMSAIFLSLAIYPRWCSLFFWQGIDLPDPTGILEGSGKGLRHVKLRSDEAYDRADVQALLEAAITRFEPLPTHGSLIIKSISATGQPRRR